MNASDDDDTVSCEGPSNQGSSIEVSDSETINTDQPTQSYSGGVRPKIKKQHISLISNCQTSVETRPPDCGTKFNGHGCSSSQSRDQQVELQQKMSVGVHNYFNYSGSSSENDDECCVYMLKGYSGRDTPPVGRLNIHDDKETRQSSSPEMDFLEMDFDPGQSNGHDDCSDESDCDREQSGIRPNNMLCDVAGNNVNDPESEITYSTIRTENVNVVPSLARLAEVASSNADMEISSSKSSVERCSAIPTLRVTPLRVVGDSILTPNEATSSHVQEVEMDPCATAIIWSESEAELKQVTKLGSPERGVAAVVNAIASFNIDFRTETVHTVLDNVKSFEECTLVQYLFMRSVFCSSHEEIIKAISQVSRGSLTSRFFSTFPRRQLALCAWLLYWVHKGAVPVLTMRQQRGTQSAYCSNGGWQHRMVSGVTSREIYLTDPVSRFPEATIIENLSSPSTVFIPRSEIVSRWRPDIDLTLLMNHTDQAWKTLNVLGQVVNIIRDEMRGRKANDVHYITIPTKLTCGVTLVMSTDNPNVKDLEQTSELPIAPAF